MDSLLHVPTILNRTQIPETTIHDLAEQISVLFNPQKIILFGSYAYGTPRPESDVDLLVVMDTHLSELEQAAVICRTIPYRFGLDLLVYTPERLAQRLEWGDSFLREIMQRGTILMESAPPDLQTMAGDQPALAWAPPSEAAASRRSNTTMRR
jgi:predicted nucleotidyltransferase